MNIRTSVGKSISGEMSMVHEGYKETELGKIPVQWEVVTLETICHIEMGQSPPSTSYNTNEVGLPFLQGCSEFGVKNPNFRVFCESPLKKAQSGDILISVRAPVGELNISLSLCCIGRGLAAISSNNNTDPTFLYYSLNIKKDVLNTQSVGSTFSAISRSVLENLLLPFPPLPEQRRIAAVLTTIDEAIDKTEALITKLRQVKVGLMQDLLTKGIDEEGRIRSEVTDAFKDSEIGRVPVEWRVVKIDEIKAKKKNAIAMGPFGSDITVDNFIESGIPVIRGQNLFTHYVNDDGFVFISEKKADQLAASNSYRNDIVITHRGTIGQVSIIPYDSKFDRYVVSQSQMKLTCNENLVNPYFVNYYLNSEIGRNSLLFRAGYTGVPAIGQPTTSLKGITIPMPSLNEQNKLNSIFKTADDRITEEEAYRDKLLDMKQGLMTDLLTGKVRVPESIEV